MFLLTPLQQLRRLDKLSPKFPERLTDLINGQRYRNCIVGLQDEDVAWLVEFLDDVRSRTLRVISLLKPA
jgi:hypothetical protein